MIQYFLHYLTMYNFKYFVLHVTLTAAAEKKNLSLNIKSQAHPRAKKWSVLSSNTGVNNWFNVILVKVIGPTHVVFNVYLLDLI